MKRGIAAMSGGVDSSVAAFLLRKQGDALMGVTLLLQSSAEDACGSGSDANDAAKVCAALGIPHESWDMRDIFRQQVQDRFCACYRSGGTPNPCIDCNRFLKFGLLYDYAKQLGCDCIATGHYARIEQAENGRWLLKKALDPAKDQSYVLYALTQEQLSRTCFPLGGYSKPEIRAMAEERGFVNAKKKDSQDICFVPDGDYAAFITRRTGKRYAPGKFVLENGTSIGRHKGLIHYTVGQRKGLGIAWAHPLYVLRKDTARNEVILSDNAALFSDRLTARDFNWIAFDAPQDSIRCTAKTRYQAKEVACTVTALPGSRAEVRFDAPVRAITAGQAVVLYDGDTVLGGGTIE